MGGVVIGLFISAVVCIAIFTVGRVVGWLSRRRHRGSGEVVHVEGPLDRIGNRWLMRIPLNVGGSALLESVRGAGKVNGEILEVELPETLVRNQGLQEGHRLRVHNEDGKFTFEWEPRSASVN